MLEKLIVGIKDVELPEGAKVVLGFSGGADSLALAHALRSLQYEIELVHVNHQLRPSATAEVDLLQAWASSQGLNFTSIPVKARDYSEANALNLEQAARALRYQSLFRTAEELKCEAVVVAHHADDQVETVLMNFLRGAGQTGLAGMDYRSMPTQWSSTIPLLRPLLGVSRKEIEEYCLSNQLEALEDESNTDIAFRRNRIRHELLPYLEDFNPEIRRAVLQASEIIRTEDEYLNGLALEALASVLIDEREGRIEINRSGLLEIPKALQRRVVRILLGRVDNVHEIGYQDTLGALHQLEQAEHGYVGELIPGMELFRKGDRLLIFRGVVPQAEISFLYPTLDVERQLSSVEGELHLSAEWLLRVEKFHLKDNEEFVFGVDEVLLPEVDSVLNIRFWQPGDRMKVEGLAGHSKKLSDLFIDAKVPRRVRATWPIVCRGLEIVWVPLLARPAGGLKELEDAPAIHLRLIKR